MANIQSLLDKGRSFLASCAQPHLESRLLLQKCTSMTEEELFSHPEKEVSADQEKCFTELLKKRKSGIPLPYLIGEKEFWSTSFRVTPGVLIPRPETELIVEKTVMFSSRDREVIADIGTGSGNIALALAKELPLATIYATDNSQKALQTAERNARLLEISNVHFLKGNLFEPLRSRNLQESCDFIVSNPPYIAEHEWKTLSSEVKDHEPQRALVAGKSGLEIIIKLVEEASAFLKPGGRLIFEIGYKQKKKVLSLFDKGWTEISCHQDLSRVPRVVTAKKMEP